MATFKRTRGHVYFLQQKLDATPDTNYWKKFETSPLIKEHGAINHVDVSPVEPYIAAVTASNKVQLYCCQSKQLLRTISRFRHAAYGASFRSDGKLLVVGTDEGDCRMFDTSKKTMLRVFEGHKRAVHACRFLPSNTHVVSASDSGSVCVHDIPTGSCLHTFDKAHSDCTRTLTTTPACEQLFYTGGYDHDISLFDTRLKSPVLRLEHGFPVECVLAFPTGGLLLSAGGPVVRLWDALNPAQPIVSLQRHHMTVTAMAFAAENTRVVTVGLDKRLKVHETSVGMKEVFAKSLPEPPLTVAVAPKDETLCVGMVDGRLLLQTRKHEEVEKPKQVFKLAVKSKTFSEIQADSLIAHKKKEILAKYDKYFRKFSYTKALDAALAPHVRIKQPEATVAVFEELVRRRGLRAALAGRTDTELVRVVRFLGRHITDARFSHVLIDVTSVLLDLYEHSALSPLRRELHLLQAAVAQELSFGEQLQQLSGQLQLLFASAEGGHPSSSAALLPVLSADDLEPPVKRVAVDESAENDSELSI